MVAWFITIYLSVQSRENSFLSRSTVTPVKSEVDRDKNEFFLVTYIYPHCSAMISTSWCVRFVKTAILWHIASTAMRGCTNPFSPSSAGPEIRINGSCHTWMRNGTNKLESVTCDCKQRINESIFDLIFSPSNTYTLGTSARSRLNNIYCDACTCLNNVFTRLYVHTVVHAQVCARTHTKLCLDHHTNTSVESRLFFSCCLLSQSKLS